MNFRRNFCLGGVGKVLTHPMIELLITTTNRQALQRGKWFIMPKAGFNSKQFFYEIASIT